MSIKLGSLDESVFDGNTILLKTSEEINKNRHVYIGGEKIYSYITNDDTLKYISNMGNNMTPYSIAVGEKKMYTFYLHVVKTKNERKLKTANC